MDHDAGASGACVSPGRKDREYRLSDYCRVASELGRETLYLEKSLLEWQKFSTNRHPSPSWLLRRTHGFLLLKGVGRSQPRELRRHGFCIVIRESASRGRAFALREASENGSSGPLLELERFRAFWPRRPVGTWHTEDLGQKREPRLLRASTIRATDDPSAGGQQRRAGSCMNGRVRPGDACMARFPSACITNERWMVVLLVRGACHKPRHAPRRQGRDFVPALFLFRRRPAPLHAERANQTLAACAGSRAPSLCLRMFSSVAGSRWFFGGR